jgi:hypothetical protein
VERPLRDYSDPLDRDDAYLVSRYRFSREGIVKLIEIVIDDIRHPSLKNNVLPPSYIVLAALRLLATGQFHLRLSVGG